MQLNIASFCQIYDFPLFAGEELYKCGHLIVEHLQ